MSIASPEIDVADGVAPDAKSRPWKDAARELAKHVAKRLVNRRDRHGRYFARDGTVSQFTAYKLDDAHIRRHFEAEDTIDIIGLLAVAAEPAEGIGRSVSVSRWFRTDIDHHDPGPAPAANLAAALKWRADLIALGFRPILVDSNGKGGYWLDVWFEEPVLARHARLLGLWLTRDWKALGLAEPPEVFPKQEAVSEGDGPGSCGNWARLYGRHHKRPHWSLVYDGEEFVGGEDAIRLILDAAGDPATLIPAAALAYESDLTGGRPPREVKPLTDDELQGEAARARDALRFLGAGVKDAGGNEYLSDYKLWRNMGFALHQLGEIGFRIWVEWSALCEDKFDEDYCARMWSKMKPGRGKKITLGTLFAAAMAAGWRPPLAAEALDDSPPSAERAAEPRTAPVVAIEVSREEWRTVADCLEAVANDPGIFQRANALAMVLRDVKPSKMIARPPGSPTIGFLPKARLREQLSKYGCWYKMGLDPESGQYKKVLCHPADFAVDQVFHRREYPGLRPIEGVVEVPVLKPGGAVLCRRGYDAETGLLLEPNVDVPGLHARADRALASRALAAIRHLVCDFPFADREAYGEECGVHEAAWLAAFLTPFARTAIPGPAPLFLMEASAAGSGKTLLADLISVTFSGRPMARTSLPDGDEELRKRITSIAMAGDRTVLIDNVGAGVVLGSQSLDAALTGTTWKDRLLGTNEYAEFPLHTTWFATGNNVAIKADIRRRIIPCRLEPQTDQPDRRADFRIKDLLPYAALHRGQLVSAALCILRAYCESGESSRLGRFGSFEAWSDLVREAVHWVTGRDPLDAQGILAVADGDALLREAIITGWAQLPGAATGITVSEMLKILEADLAKRYASLEDALRQLHPKGEMPTARLIGNRIRSYRGTFVGKTKFDGWLDPHSKVMYWSSA